MKNPKFKLIKDFVVKTEIAGISKEKKVIDKGAEFEPNENGTYYIKWNDDELYLNLQQMEESEYFERVQDYNIKATEINEIEEESLINFRIEFNVKTTKTKIKEFERVFNQSLKETFE